VKIFDVLDFVNSKKAGLDARNEQYEKLELKKLEDRLQEIKEFNAKRSIPVDKSENDDHSGEAQSSGLKETAARGDVDSDDDEIVRKMLAEAEKSYKSQILNEKEARIY
jgi:hypothetical protein